MEIKIEYNHSLSDFIINLLEYLFELKEQGGITTKIYQLNSSGYKLNHIEKNIFAIKGIFTNKNFEKAIWIPYYRINEDILDQLRILIEEHNQYILEKNNLTNQNFNYKITLIDLLDLESDKINWEVVYKTPIYNKLFFNIAIELLYYKLFEFLNQTYIFNDLNSKKKEYL